MIECSRTQPTPVMPPFVQRPGRRLAKLLISSVYYLGAELIAAGCRLLGYAPRERVVSIFYHQVSREQRGRFARQMDHLLRWTRPIHCDDFGELRPETRYAMVTADDAWLSFIENALPELERRHIPVTIFAISDYLGQSLGQPNDRLATEDELKHLDPALVRVGSHTATHARLTSLGEEAAWSELADSRSKLEDRLHTGVELFSFPFGACTDLLLKKCGDAGYRRAFLALPWTARQSAEFVVGRIRVDPTDWPLEFHLKLMGAYDWLPRAISLKRWLTSLLRTGRSGLDAHREHGRSLAHTT